MTLFLIKFATTAPFTPGARMAKLNDLATGAVVVAAAVAAVAVAGVDAKHHHSQKRLY